MRIGLIGYGQMGRLVERVAGENGMEIAARFTSARPLRADAESRERLRGVDTLVDFSVAEAVPESARQAAGLRLNLVIGTTGWHDRVEEVRRAADGAGIGVVYGSNFSLGVNLFYRLVEAAAQAVAVHEGYEPYVEEQHHRHKRDSPSGTAVDLASRLERFYPGRSIPVASLRAGYIPGSHLVGFDSVADTIRLEHTARSRQGFAEGALHAARWIAGRTGFYEFSERFDEITGTAREAG